MKAHKYWSLGALACMAVCFYTGCKKLIQAHKYFACGSLVCMGEYYGAAEPPVRCGESHLSGLTEPPHFVY